MDRTKRTCRRCAGLLLAAWPLLLSHIPFSPSRSKSSLAHLRALPFPHVGFVRPTCKPGLMGEEVVARTRAWTLRRFLRSKPSCKSLWVRGDPGGVSQFKAFHRLAADDVFTSGDPNDDEFGISSREKVFPVLGSGHAGRRRVEFHRLHVKKLHGGISNSKRRNYKNRKGGHEYIYGNEDEDLNYEKKNEVTFGDLGLHQKRKPRMNKRLKTLKAKSNSKGKRREAYVNAHDESFGEKGFEEYIKRIRRKMPAMQMGDAGSDQSRDIEDEEILLETQEDEGEKVPRKEFKNLYEWRLDKYSQIAGFQLSQRQLQVVSVVESGQSIFYTGNAGTGKSALLKVITKVVRNKTRMSPVRRNSQLHVTASTGTAASHIGGTTLHSFAGIGLGADTVDRLVDTIQKNPRSVWRWESCGTLIIDEISMVQDSLFEKVEEIARRIRGDDSPFGGIQLVLTGDFLQLPPVSRGRGMARFAFLSPVWSKCITRRMLLTDVFRQSDPIFANALNELRMGVMSNGTHDLFRKAMNRNLKNLSGIEPTRLYVHNIHVDRINDEKLSTLAGEEKVFKAKDYGKEPFLSILRKNSPVSENLKLRIGAQVLLLQNLDVSLGLVNGARGVVIRYEKFYPHSEEEVSPDRKKSRRQEILEFVSTGKIFPVVRFARRSPNGTVTNDERIILAHNFTLDINGKTQAWREQVPLKLAWAISIHKSQGMTIDHLEVDMQGCFAYGQAYVALSRAKSFQGLRLLNFQRSMVKAEPRAVEFYHTMAKEAEEEEAKEKYQKVPAEEQYVFQDHSDLQLEKMIEGIEKTDSIAEYTISDAMTPREFRKEFKDAEKAFEAGDICAGVEMQSF